jgi:pimeloyl-ACP methyl ester carboxylesterase
MTVAGRRPPKTVAVTAAAAIAWWAVHARSPAVRRWRPGAGRRVQAGPLSVRVHGEAPTALLLLHGLPATGDTFGAAFDALDAQLVIPDLLGFGRSKLPADRQVSLAAQLAALDEAAAALGLQDKRLIVAGHSMGGVLAWAWAARRAAQVDAVLTWCAPLFDGPEDARRALNAKVPGLGWIGVPGRLSELVFARLCDRYPAAAQRLYVLLYPRIPLGLARRLTDYTWPAYEAAMNDIVLDRQAWSSSVHALVEQGVPVTYAAGARDVLAPAHAVGRLGPDASAIAVVTQPHADHLLPLSDPQWCTALLRPLLDRTPRSRCPASGGRTAHTGRTAGDGARDGHRDGMAG